MCTYMCTMYTGRFVRCGNKQRGKGTGGTCTQVIFYNVMHTPTQHPHNKCNTRVIALAPICTAVHVLVCRSKCQTCVPVRVPVPGSSYRVPCMHIAVKRTRRGERHGHSLLGLQCKLVMGNVLGRLSQRTPAWALFSFGLTGRGSDHRTCNIVLSKNAI